MRHLTISATLALTAACLGSIGTAQAEVSAWTGCVNNGGNIHSMAQGDQPLKPCNGNHTLIHLRDEAAFQNTDANYKQGANCEAFHELGLSAPALDKIGCPTTPTLTKEGTVTRVKGSDLIANNYNVCGILKAETNPSWTPSYHWVVPGGFVASTSKTALSGGGGECELLCDSDDKCIAANFTASGGTSQFGTCRVYHYSDNLDADWSHFCGYDLGLDALGCAGRLNTFADKWFVRVPDGDGESIGNCPDSATP
jgi:hypothetical protein